MKWLVGLCFAAACLGACNFGDNTRDPIREAPDADDIVTFDAPPALPPIDAAQGAPDAAPVPDAAEHADAGITTPPDAAPPPPSCSILPQAGCSSATPACDLTSADDGTLGCRAVTKQGTSASHCAAHTDCKVGYTCIDDGVAADASWCGRFCAADAGCLGTGSRCVDELTDANGQDLGVAVCSNACNPTAQSGCPSGMGCLAFEDAGGDFTDCLYQGTTADGATCTSDADCVNGDACVDDGSGTATCARLCTVGDDTTCPGAELCNSFSTPLVIGAVEYGVCQE